MWIYRIFVQMAMFFLDINKKNRASNIGRIKYDTQTKITILQEQINELLQKNNESEILATENYIHKIIDELIIDFKREPFKVENLHQLKNVLSSTPIDKKEVKSILMNI